jgi:hypothetical protein
MIRVGLFAKQTQVFDKKADQMAEANAGGGVRQLAKPRPVWCL